jgi:hypothetical protein
LEGGEAVAGCQGGVEKPKEKKMTITNTTLFLIAIIVVAVVALIYFQRIMRQRRIEALQQAGAGLGLFLAAEGDAAALQASLSGFHLFNQGHSRRLIGLIQGVARGVPVFVFDYRYFITSGNSNNRIREQTVVGFELSGTDLPAFALRSETVWNKMGSWMGSQDIDFENAPDFSARYFLQGTDEAAVRRLFAERVLAFYTAHPGLCTEGGGDRLIVYRADKRVKPEALSAFVDEGLEVLDLFKPQAEAYASDAIPYQA